MVTDRDPPMASVTSIDALRPSMPQRLQELMARHKAIEGLCDEVEAIADDLPGACPQRCSRVLAMLNDLLPAHLASERDALRSLADAPDLRERIGRLIDEDEGMAHEIAQALETLARGEAPPEPETLGYMLRCFFSNFGRSMLVTELAVRAALPRG